MIKLKIRESVNDNVYYVTEYFEDSTSGPEEGGWTDYGMKAFKSIKFDDYDSAKEFAEEYADPDSKVLYSGDNFTRYLIPGGPEYIIAIETPQTRGELHDPAKTWAESELGYKAPKPRFDNLGYVVENAKLSSTTTTLWKKGNISIIIDGYGFGIDNGYTVNRFIIDNEGKALYDFEPPKYIKNTVDKLIKQGKFDNPEYDPNNATKVKHTLKYGNFIEESSNNTGDNAQENTFKYDDNKWVQVDTIDGYAIYRKVINGRGYWKAITPEGDGVSITYEQALGYEPITSAKRMSTELGKKLLPKINERDYGGAFDIDPEQYFTREDLDEFGEYIAERISEKYEIDFEIYETHIENNSNLIVEVISVDDDELLGVGEADIDMRRVRKPEDIYKFSSKIITEISDDLDSQLN